jgi:hypothetical protein
MRFYANTNYYPTQQTNSANHYVVGKTIYDPELDQYVRQNLDGATSFPMTPGVSFDADGDGSYNNYVAGDTYLRVYGYIMINGIQYTLPIQFIDVTVGTTTNVYWNLNVEPGSISGSVKVAGEDIYYYYIRGNANVGGSSVTFADLNQPGSQDYTVEVPPATWVLYPDLYFYNPSTGEFNNLRLPSEAVEVHPGQAVIQDWSIEPGYVTGNIVLYGAHGNFEYAYVYGTKSGQSAHVRTFTGDYRLILNEGDWKVGFSALLGFRYDNIYDRSTLAVNNYSIYYSDPTAITAGNTVNDVDFSYGTATITVNFRIEGEGDKELHTPRLFASLNEGTFPNQILSSANSFGSSIPTTIGEGTITVLAGSHIVGAYATVDGSYTKFSEFSITVEPGDVIKQDIGAPTVVVTQPSGLEHTCDSSIDVVGTATDDTAVDDITVNGETVDFTSTNNPDDPNEVSFNTNVENLVYGENTIPIVVTDPSGNSITVDRIVIRDNCNDPPIADAGSDQIVEQTSFAGTEVTLDASGSSDPDGDSLTYTWTWNGGSTNGVNPTVTLPSGTHIITLIVSDGVETDSDEVVITIQDTTPPEITVLSEPFILWPSNHKYQTFTVADFVLSITDAVDSDISIVDILITSVSSDEPEDATGDGDGNTMSDIVISDSQTVQLRAERQGSGNGRVYTINLETADSSGNKATASIQVWVPHSEKSGAIDDGLSAGYIVFPNPS